MISISDNLKLLGFGLAITGWGWFTVIRPAMASAIQHWPSTSDRSDQFMFKASGGICLIGGPIATIAALWFLVKRVFHLA
jgi:hypothetical protein